MSNLFLFGSMIADSCTERVVVDCRFARERTNIACCTLCLCITCKQGSTSQGPSTDTAANGMRPVYGVMNNVLLILLLVVEDLNENINDVISKCLLNNVFFSRRKRVI